MYNDWRDVHGAVICKFIKYLNSMTSNYILKGGTSLMLCYGLTRFSEDIDLDALNTSKGLEPIVKQFCIINKFEYRVAKNTDTVKRYFIHYKECSKPLKVEVSYRRKKIESSEFTKVNNILVYTVECLLSQKLDAYNSRDKIRDLYDILFICTKYLGTLSQFAKMFAANTLSYKGLGHIDYLIATQSDELINKEELENATLMVFTNLGIL